MDDRSAWVYQVAKSLINAIRLHNQPHADGDLNTGRVYKQQIYIYAGLLALDFVPPVSSNCQYGVLCLDYDQEPLAESKPPGEWGASISYLGDGS